MIFFNKVDEPWWDDNPVYIVGGGLSLVGRSLTHLYDKGYILGINRAADLIQVDATFTLDTTFLRERATALRAWARDHEVYAAVPEDWSDTLIDGVKYLERRNGTGLSGNQSVITNGLNSGYGALNLAVLKRARKVYLLGFDLVEPSKSEPTHWHGGYAWGNRSSHKYYGRWADKFRAAAEDCKSLGVEVINANPRSAITAFPTTSYDAIGI